MSLFIVSTIGGPCRHLARAVSAFGVSVRKLVPGASWLVSSVGSAAEVAHRLGVRELPGEVLVVGVDLHAVHGFADAALWRWMAEAAGQVGGVGKKSNGLRGRNRMGYLRANFFLDFDLEAEMGGIGSGGFRAGAGRPPSGKAAVTPVAAEEGKPKPAPKRRQTPLAYMLGIMRDPDADPMRRDRAAIAALPYVHPRADAVEPGKKQAAQDAANKAAKNGVFAPASAPRVVVDNNRLS
ncbi:MAG: hypothetical protein WCO00_18060 [Rhodospirillaceae bacterium]